MSQQLTAQIESVGLTAPPPSGAVEASLTDRQLREREYYEEYSRFNAPKEVCFDPVIGTERRPWNPYWFLCETVAAKLGSGDRKLLDFGCGPGIYSLIFAKAGFHVSGFDISPNNIAIAERLAAEYGLSKQAHFKIGAGERLDFDDNTFDVVVGIDILHHVDIKHSVTECLRVLKPGGCAIFKEPIEVPIFDPWRDSAFGRWLLPKDRSLERHITEDERKLTNQDLQTICRLGARMTVKRFRLFSRLDAFSKNLATNGQASPIEKFDERVFQLLPFMKTFGGDIVITLEKN
ncbi:MAG: class I SAM-dependent methyltransferase [Acidobacteriota bacterium]